MLLLLLSLLAGACHIQTQLLHGGGLGVKFAHDLALVHHKDAVGQVHHLVQLQRDQQNGLAGVALGDVVAEVDQLIAGYPVPDGVDLEIGGTVEDQGDAFSDLGVLFILIVILVYIVMATQFESLLFPFIIMFTIPFAATGVFLALWMTSTPMSLIALIGAIMLVGIVTKNGIVMVDYMNLLVERGSGVFDAVIAGGKSRLRPVLMTSFTTILGMLPLAIGTGVGSETWQPMGIAVIGGLTFSTLLTLFIIPALYSVFVNRSQRKEKEKLARLAAAHQASSH